MSKGFAMSSTDDSPEARRARIARLVGSARAAKVALRASAGIYLTNRLNTISRLVKSGLEPVPGPEDPRDHDHRPREERQGHAEAHPHVDVGEAEEAPAEAAHQVDDRV